MKHILTVFCLFILLDAIGQDTTMNNLTGDMNSDTLSNEKKLVKIFDSYRTINANTTEITGKGKMDFNVTHNFGDIAGKGGGTKTFFGIDNIQDVRIGFNIGIGKRTDLILARSRGSSEVKELWQAGIKTQLMRQFENDPSHPLSIAFFADGVVSSVKRDTLTGEINFNDFSDRLSGVLQLIVAKKMGKVSLQINPTYSFRGYARSIDQKNLFAMGGALRFPLGKHVNLVFDYFHTFRNDASKQAYLVDTLDPHRSTKFYDAIGVGFEILTAGHVFHLNFTNATEILENRFIPYTTSSWTKGQYRWGFTISRVFVLWREKH